MSRASLYDLRDLDLMLKLAETANQDGLATSVEISEALGLGDDGTTVASRLNWMRRYGMVGFDDKLRGWRLSRGGERVVEARLRAAAARTIDAIPEAQLVDVMSHVTARYRLGDPMTAALLRREFLYGTRSR